MPDKQIKGFIAFGKPCDFKSHPIHTLTIRLNDFNKFLKIKRIFRIGSVTYAHLSVFIADY